MGSGDELATENVIGKNKMENYTFPKSIVIGVLGNSQL